LVLIVSTTLNWKTVKVVWYLLGTRQLIEAAKEEEMYGWSVHPSSTTASSVSSWIRYFDNKK